MLPRTPEPQAMDGPVEAAAYDAMDHAAPNAAFVARLAELVGERAPRRVLDVGCGPGDIALLMARRWPTCQVTALDLAPAMLTIAARKIAGAGLSERVTPWRGDAKRLPFADGAFDVVVSNTIVHHMPPPDGHAVALLREAWRVLAPGGTLLIRDLFRPGDAAAVEALVARHVGGEAGAAQQLFRQSLHAAFTPAEWRGLAAAAGIAGAVVTVDTDRHVSLQVAGR